MCALPCRVSDPVPAAPDLAAMVLASPHLRARLSHPRFASDTPRVLLLEARYHLVDEVKRALLAIGAAVDAVPVVEDGPTMVKALLQGLVRHRPDFVLTINHLGFDAAGNMGRILAALEIPVAAWYVDSPLFVLRGTPVPAADLTTLFTWERALLPLYRRVCAAEWLPLAADPERFEGRRDDAAGDGIAFVGNSGAGAQQKWRARTAAGDEARVTELEAQLRPRFADPFVRPELLEDGREADRLAAATWRANSRLRADLIRRFLEERFYLYGDAGWPEVLPGAQPTAGPRYGPELAEVYRRHAVQLNVTSLQMPSAVNQRVFDVPIAGGFVLTDAQEDMLSLFEEDEVAVWSCPEEAADKARYYVRHPDRRAALARRGRDRILGEHTYAHRVRSLCKTMRSRFGQKAPRAAG